MEVATTNAPRPTSGTSLSPISSTSSVAEMDVPSNTSPSSRHPFVQQIDTYTGVYTLVTFFHTDVVIPLGAMNTTALYSVAISNSREEEGSQLGMGPIIAMALASILVLIATFMCAFVLIAVWLRRQKKLPRRRPHHHIGLGKIIFVIINATNN